MSTKNVGGADGSSSANSPRHGGATVTEDVTGSPGRKRAREVGQSSAAGGVAGNVAPPPPPAQPQQNTICVVCGRRFNSRQALFGHMRLHGNRGWRGAFPPPVFNRDEFADVLPLLAPAVAAAEVADAPAQPQAAAAVPDLNEPHQYRVPDLNFPPPPA